MEYKVNMKWGKYSKGDIISLEDNSVIQKGIQVGLLTPLDEIVSETKKASKKK